MDPNSGRIIEAEALEELRRSDPDKAAKFSVMLEGTREDIESIASAVQSAHSSKAKAANRRKNKTARLARRAGR